MLSYSEVGEILALIDKSSCDEVVLETDDVKLVVRRKGAGGAPAVEQITQDVAPASSAPKAESIRSPAPAKASPAAPQESGGIVSAPMVGTFYRAPSPDEPPFVEVGSKVAAGDPLCVIEVMKLFTTVHAESAGTVSQIGPGDAELVEYGQMLFVLDPA